MADVRSQVGRRTRAAIVIALVCRAIASRIYHGWIVRKGRKVVVTCCDGYTRSLDLKAVKAHATAANMDIGHFLRGTPTPRTGDPPRRNPRRRRR